MLIIVAGAIAVRFYNLGGQSLWSDEGNSAALATRSLIQIARDASHDIHPPLYYWLLHIWTRVAGTSEVGLRSFSVLTGLLLALAAGVVGRRLFDLPTGLVTAFVIALSPFAVYYSQEARMYTLLALEATVVVLAFWGYVSQEDNRLPVDGSSPRYLRWLPASGQFMILAWAAGLYTHYAFPLIIAMLTGLYAVWLAVSWRRGRVVRRLLRWGILLAITAGLYAPWLPIALSQLTTWPTGGNPVDLRTALPISLAILGLGPIARDQAGLWWMWSLPALAIIGLLAWPRGQRLGWLRWAIPAAWTAAPLVLILGFGLFRDAYLKFLLIASPAYSLLLARGVLALAGGLRASPLPKASGRLATTWGWLRGVLGAGWIVAALALVGGLSGVTLARYYTDPAVARDDYRGIVQFIAATAHPGDAILLDAPGQSEVFNYYYRGDLPIYPLPRQRPIRPEETLQELDRLLSHDKIYAVYWATAEADPKGLIETWMDNHGYKTLDQWRGNVRLAVYVMPERRPPDEAVDDLGQRFSAGIVLLGYRGWNLAPTAGQVTQLQLLWQAERQLVRRYKVFLQLLDPREQVIAQRDSEPAGDSRPTDTWDAGEVIQDNHGLLIPLGTPPGTYRRIIGLYDRDTGERLKLSDGKDFISLPPITVARAASSPPLAALNMLYNQQFDFGGITLLGHDRYKRGFGHVPDTALTPGDRLHLTFYWQANVQPRADWWFDLTLNDASGRAVAQLEAPLVSASYATPLWQKGEVVRGEHDLLLPDDLPPDTYRLSLALLPDVATQAGTAYLGTVKVVKKIE
ncbi:MAG: glycosyltransferase family 39 protein [Chloroflexi bacterium]|nr:glycosyltransferase family 39 protein [Chloroflexota bacterium]